jgi:potassium channel subfamily K, other eukaryote
LLDIINITAVTIFGVEHRFDDGFTYGQPFWMTLCATIAALFTNITLVYDLYHTRDFAKSGKFPHP